MKYYYNGQLLRTSKKDTYYYTCLESNQFAATKEELVKRVHSEAWYIYNDYKRNQVFKMRARNWSYAEYEKILEDLRVEAVEKETRYVNSIVELTRVE